MNEEPKKVEWYRSPIHSQGNDLADLDRTSWFESIIHQSAAARRRLQDA